MSLPCSTASFSSLNGMTRHDRAEDLLLRDAHVVAHAGEDRRLHEVALLEARRGVALAAGERLRALLLADLEVAGDALELLLADQRPDLRARRRGRGPCFMRPRALATASANSSCIFSSTKSRVPAQHTCALVEEDADQRALHGRRSTSASAKTMFGRLAAELERHALQRARPSRGGSPCRPRSSR